MRWKICFLMFLLTGCWGEKTKKRIFPEEVIVVNIMVADSVKTRGEVGKKQVAEDTETEKRLRGLGMVDIMEVDTSIKVHLVYATPDNFVGQILYTDLQKAFMLPETARRLSDAQRVLKDLRPDLSLIIYDAVRPMSVQRTMWAQVRGTDKRIFVSNPANGGGLHNYGAALDVTLVDSVGKALAMGSPFDYFGDEARPDREEIMISQGRISAREAENRLLLRRVMKEAGFRPLHSEWWHFNLMSREDAKKQLKVIE